MSKGNGWGLTSGGLGVVPAAHAQVDTTKKAPAPVRPMKPGEAQTLMIAELLQAAQGVAESSTALLAAIGRAGSLNGVLGVDLITLDATGIWQVDYPATVGSIALVNHGANPMTVASGAQQLSAPTTGRGVQKIAAGSRLTMPVGDRALTVYGTAGDSFSLQAFTGLQVFGVGL